MKITFLRHNKKISDISNYVDIPNEYFTTSLTNGINLSYKGEKIFQWWINTDIYDNTNEAINKIIEKAVVLIRNHKLDIILI